MNRFLCGVDGTKLEPPGDPECARVEWILSGSDAMPGGNAVGMVLSNISARSKDENVRLASSAASDG